VENYRMINSLFIFFAHERCGGGSMDSEMRKSYKIVIKNL
jgi:hypothetical protein